MRWQLIDRIVACEPGQTIVAEKTFPASEPLFEDHFPGYPIVPGVLQIEMIAQAGGKCAAMAMPGILPVLGSIKSAKFYAQIRPEDLCTIKATVTKIAKSYVLADGEIEVGGKRVCTASILYGTIDRTLLSSESFDRVTQEWLSRPQSDDTAPPETAEAVP